MRFAFASFIAVVAATLAAAQPRTRDTLTINPDPKVLEGHTGQNGASAPAPLTNAKRFELHMPPLKPRVHRRSPHRSGLSRGTRVQTAPRAMTSPLPPVSQKCNIKAASTNGTDFGFISPVWNGFGEYGLFQPAQDGALEVSFSYSADSSSQLDFIATNGPSATFPFVGAIVGFASTSNDFSVGSYNYAYLGGTTQSPPGSPAFTEGDNSFSAATGIPADIESAVWSYNSETQAITAQWINTDGSAPPTHIIFANDSNQALALTGDVVTFQETFGAPYPEVTFTCVPPPSVYTSRA